jgi:hypothetical protein
MSAAASVGCSTPSARSRSSGRSRRRAPLTTTAPRWSSADGRAAVTSDQRRARRQATAAEHALDVADLLADAIFEGVTQRTLESLARQYRAARQSAEEAKA